MPDNDQPAPERAPEHYTVPEDDSYERPESVWWLFIPGGAVALAIHRIAWAVCPGRRREATLQFCRYYSFDMIPRGKHARLTFEGGGDGSIEVFVTPPGAPLPPAPGTTPRVHVTGTGKMSVYGPGVLTLHQSRPGSRNVKVRMTLESG